MKFFYILSILYIASTLTMQYPNEHWITIKSISFHGPTSCVYDKDNKFVIGLTNHTCIVQYYFNSSPVSISFEYKSPVVQITLSPAQKYLYGVSSKDPHCTKRLYTLWSMATKKILHQLELPNFYYHMSPHDTYLITQDSGTVQVRDAQTSTMLHTIAPIHDDITKLSDPYFTPSFNPIETLMAIAHKPPKAQATCNADKSRIINLATGKVANIYGSQCTPAFSPNNEYIATATEKDEVKLWDIKKLQLIATLTKSPACALLFTTHNRLIIKNIPLNGHYVAILAEEAPVADTIFPSLIIANPTTQTQPPENHNNTICSADGSRLCTLHHHKEYDILGFSHAFICTFIDSNTARKKCISCDIRKLYPAPLYMSPHGQYIIIPSYEYDLIANAHQKTRVYHPGGRYGNMHFSNNEASIAYQLDKQTAVLLKRIS